MANIQNIPLNEKLRDSNPKINQNFQSLNNELTGHINSTSAHKSEDITYSGEVPGSNVKQAIDSLDIRIDDIVAQSGDDITEIVDARGGYTVLGDRLNAFGNDFVSVRNAENVKNSKVIQNALDLSEVLGGVTIYLPAGTYEITELLKIPSNTKLIGLGKVILKRMADINGILINKADGVTGGYAANKNIAVENITFDANNQEFPSNVTSLSFGHCTNITIINCQFKKCYTWHDLELNACKNVKVDNCLFDDYHGTSENVQLDYAGTEAQFPWFGPFDSTACEDVTIENCEFFDSTRTKTAIGNHTFKAGSVSKDIKLLKNTLNNFMIGVNLNDVEKFTIDKNVFKDTIIGVRFEEKQNDSKDWNIINNFFEIITPIPDGFAPDGRFFWGVTYPLIKVFERLSIKNNKIINCFLHGIGFTATRKVDISDNTIESCGRNGIYLFGCADVSIKNNKCTGNNVRGESNRADIVIGGSPVISSNVILSENIIESAIISNTNVSKVLFTNNIVKLSLVNNSGAEGILKNNLVAGVWTP